MDKFTSEFERVLTDKSDKFTIGQLWENQPPVMHWCLGLTSLSFGFIYLFLFTML
ncbi:MAG TPA: hypothetical protein P5556_02610 [Candidatus Gastranaerophilales bacterium]|nr:hypothetical protein [Candidatus Gastranaerophilales bacterium]